MSSLLCAINTACIYNETDAVLWKYFLRNILNSAPLDFTADSELVICSKISAACGLHSVNLQVKSTATEGEKESGWHLTYETPTGIAGVKVTVQLTNWTATLARARSVGVS